MPCHRILGVGMSIYWSCALASEKCLPRHFQVISTSHCTFEEGGNQWKEVNLIPFMTESVFQFGQSKKTSFCLFYTVLCAKALYLLTPGVVVSDRDCDGLCPCSYQACFQSAPLICALQEPIQMAFKRKLNQRLWWGIMKKYHFLASWLGPPPTA